MPPLRVAVRPGTERSTSVTPGVWSRAISSALMTLTERPTLLTGVSARLAVTTICSLPSSASAAVAGAIAIKMLAYF